MRLINTVQHGSTVSNGATCRIYPNNVISNGRALFDYSLYTKDLEDNNVAFRDAPKEDESYEFNGSVVLDNERYLKYDVYTNSTYFKRMYGLGTLREVTKATYRKNSQGMDFSGINNDNMHDGSFIYMYSQYIYVSDKADMFSYDDPHIRYTYGSYGSYRLEALTVIHSENNGTLAAIGTYFVLLEGVRIVVFVWDGAAFTEHEYVFPIALNDAQPLIQRLYENVTKTNIDGTYYCEEADYIFACSGQYDETYLVRINIDKTNGINPITIIENLQETNEVDRSSYEVLRDIANDNAILRSVKPYITSLSIAEELNFTPNINEQGTLFKEEEIDYETFIHQYREFGVYEENNKLFLHTSVMSYINGTLQVTPVYLYIDLAFTFDAPTFKVWGYSQNGSTTDIIFINYTPSVALRYNVIKLKEPIVQNYVCMLDDFYHHTTSDILDPSIPDNVRVKVTQLHQLTFVNDLYNGYLRDNEIVTVQMQLSQVVTDNRIYPPAYDLAQIPYVNTLIDMREFIYQPTTSLTYGFLEDFQYRLLENSPNILMRKGVSAEEQMPQTMTFFKAIQDTIITSSVLYYSNNDTIDHRLFYDPKLCTILNINAVANHNPMYEIYSLNDSENYNLKIRDAIIDDAKLLINIDIMAMYLLLEIDCYIYITIPDHINLVINDVIGGTGYLKELLVHLDRSVYTNLTFKAEDDSIITQESIKDINLVQFSMFNHSTATQQLKG